MGAIKPRWHQSHMSLAGKCGMMLKFFLEGIIIPPGIAMIVGKGTHKSIESNLRNKMDEGEMLDEDQCSDAARDGVNDEWTDDIRMFDADKAIGKKATKGNAVDKAVRLAGLHRSELAPDINPTHIERPFLLEIDNFAVNLAGTIDIQEDGIIRDTKTAAKSPSKNAAEISEQLTFYHMAAEKLDGCKIHKLSLDSLVDLKTPKVSRLETTRDESDHARLLLRVSHDVDMVHKGAFHPCSTMAWWCSDMYCGYWADKCPFGRRQSTGHRDG